MIYFIETTFYDIITKYIVECRVVTISNSNKYSDSSYDEKLMVFLVLSNLYKNLKTYSMENVKIFDTINMSTISKCINLLRLRTIIMNPILSEFNEIYNENVEYMVLFKNYFSVPLPG